MSMPAAVRSWMCAGPLVVVFVAAPALALAQGRARWPRIDAGPDSVIVTAPNTKIRGSPSSEGLTLEVLPRGIALPVVRGGGVPKEWVAVVLDERVAFLPREAVVIKEHGAPTFASREAAAAPPENPPEKAPAEEPLVSAKPTPTAPPPAAPQQVAAAHAATVMQQGTVVQQGSAAQTQAGALQPGGHVHPATAAQPAAAPRPTTASPAATAPAPAAAPQVAAAPASAAGPESASSPSSTATSPKPAGTQSTELPAPRRSGFSLGVDVGAFASAAQLDQPVGSPVIHVDGVPFLAITHRGWGLYAAPGFGNSVPYRSTLLSGGLSRDLLNFDQLRVTALAGYASYTVYTRDPSLPVPASRSLRGPAFGGMASVPFLGPIRFAYFGRYIAGQSNGTAVHLTRHAVGLLF